MSLLDFGRFSSSQRELLTKLEGASTVPMNGHIDAVSGNLRDLRGSFALDRRGQLFADIQRFLEPYAATFGLPAQLSGLGSPTIDSLDDGGNRVVLRELRDSIPVYRSGVEVEVDNNDQVRSVVVRLASGRGAPGAATRSTADVRSAVQRSLVAEFSDQVKIGNPELVVVDPLFLFGEPATPWLGWRFEFDGDGGRHEIIVDDATGAVAFAAGPPALTTTLPPSSGTTTPPSSGIGVPTPGSTGIGIGTAPIPRYHLNPATGTPDFVSFGPFGLILPEAASGNPAQVALALFTRYPLLFGTGDVMNQLRVRSVVVDAGAYPMHHVILDQEYAGLEVFGCELRVHLSNALAVQSISGAYLRDPGVLVTPTVNQSTARETAVRFISALRTTIPSPVAPATFSPLPVARAAARTLTAAPATTAPFRAAPTTIGGVTGWLDGPRVRPLLTAQPNEAIVDRFNRLNAATAIHFDIRDWQILNQARAELLDAGLVVLPTVLSDVSTGTNNLSWRFRSMESDIFVDAHNGQIVFAISNMHNAREIYDGGGTPPSVATVFSPLILRDGVNVAPTPANNPDIVPADARLATSIGFWATLGRLSWDGAGADSKLVTNVAFSPRNAMSVPLVNQLWFGGGQIAQDVVTHEFTHAVTWVTSGLLYIDESGALNEHYSDVMGNLSSPDVPAGWLIGELTTGGSLRNMAAPVVSNYAAYRRRGPGCTGALDPITTLACDMGGVHTNSGIGNLAAVRLCDGDATPLHPGIGRSRLGRLFADTLTTRLFPWARYIDEAHNTWEAASDLAARGIVPAPLPADPTPQAFNTAAVNEVSWAFQSVGVDRRLTTGWFEVGGGLSGGSGFTTFYAGESLPSGSIVGDVELVVRGIFLGARYWEGRALASTGGTVAFDGGIFGAAIISQGIGTTSKTTVVRWFHSGFLPLEITVNIIPTAGPLPTVIEVVSAAQVHWGGLGGKGDETVNAGASVSGAGCVIDDVILELLDRNYAVQATTHLGAPAATYGGTGARITSHGVGGTDKSVGVHWWYDLGWACRYQIRYLISGTGCS